jgi:hypothetical protein
LDIEKTGALAATSGWAGHSPVPKPSDASGLSSPTCTARSTIGTPGYLGQEGHSATARGLTSIVHPGVEDDVLNIEEPAYAEGFAERVV